MGKKQKKEKKKDVNLYSKGENISLLKEKEITAVFSINLMNNLSITVTC